MDTATCEIKLTNDTIWLYREALENGSYDDDTWATNDGRMVSFINPDEHSNYRFYLHTTDGLYLSEVKTIEEALHFLMTGEYVDCWDGKRKVW